MITPNMLWQMRGPMHPGCCRTRQLILSHALFCRFGQLQNVNTEGVEPALRAATDEANGLRPDVVKEFENRCADAGPH